MSPVELVCFHHAGGGSTSFHRLRRELAKSSPAVSLTPVTLPGRGSRRHEPPHVEMDTCVRALAGELGDLLTRPHVLLGHSMGAVLAYLVAQLRVSRGLRAPEAVIAASSRAPGNPPPLDGLHHLDDRALAEALASYGGLPPEILDRPEWLAVLIPTVRADLQIIRSYQPSCGPPLPCPVYAFGGVDDPLVPLDMLTAWSVHTAEPQPVRLYPGGHFLFRTPEPALVNDIARIAHHGGLDERLVS